MSIPLASRLDKMAGHRILCIGDVMLDRYVYGHVDRISPEAPIPVFRVDREQVTLGGAGNVARNIVALGGTVDFIGVIGSDQAGYDLSKQVSALPQISSYLLTDRTRPTTLKTRYVASAQQLLRADLEIAAPLSVEMEQQVLMRAKSALTSGGVVILSDYAKGVLSPRVVSEILRSAQEKGAKVLIDPKGRDFSLYRGATILTPNRKELAEAAGSAIANIDDAEQAARQLIDKHQLQGILAKLGGDGVCLVMRGEPAQHFHTVTREVFDVSGAGDTVVATLALAIAGGLTLPESAELANLAGAIVVGKVGTATVSRDELSRAIMHEHMQGEGKIALSADAAKDAADLWRKQGLKVGFTNGCFDLLHPGHISLLRQARAACDRLIVGLNSDASVKRLKGETRPVQNENARAAVLASLADVDLVVLFGEDTPYELIKTVHPDVLVKGADYTIDKVVGADLVQGWGGKVVLANLVDGHSTTSIIARSKIPESKTGSAA
jgi:D-beta-D-heptose 7-phosphate kinase / D-beta-D-heptose 1-phosphate adenosyltransferase